MAAWIEGKGFINAVLGKDKAQSADFAALQANKDAAETLTLLNQ